MLPGKVQLGFAVVGNTGGDNGLGPFGMVYRIGVVLGFQSHTGTLGVGNATLANEVQVIAGIELNTGQIGGDSHGTAGFRSEWHRDR